MANHRDFTTVLVVGLLALLVASVGLFLGFNSNRIVPAGTPMPVAPESGPVVYEMRYVRSDADRVRFEWRDVRGAAGYRVTILTASDDSLLSGPEVHTTYWTLPPELRGRLARATAYHWRLTVRFPNRAPAVSEPAVFTTQ